MAEGLKSDRTQLKGFLDNYSLCESEELLERCWMSTNEMIPEKLHHTACH